MRDEPREAGAAMREHAEGISTTPPKRLKQPLSAGHDGASGAIFLPAPDSSSSVRTNHGY